MIVKVSLKIYIKIVYLYFVWLKIKKNYKYDKIMFQIDLNILIINNWFQLYFHK